MLLVLTLVTVISLWGLMMVKTLSSLANFHRPTKTGDEYGMLINELFRFQGMDMNDIDDIIISSVVPPLVIPISKMCERYFKIKPLLVGPGIKTGIRLVYENPRLLGADRIVNVVGAFEQYGGPLIVIDIGTATTFDVVNDKGDF